MLIDVLPSGGSTGPPFLILYLLLNFGLVGFAVLGSIVCLTIYHWPCGKTDNAVEDAGAPANDQDLHDKQNGHDPQSQSAKSLSRNAGGTVSEDENEKVESGKDRLHVGSDDETAFIKVISFIMILVFFHPLIY